MASMTPWQCGLHNSKDRDNALFLNERMSDLTIIFPYHKISFPAHRLMMAKTSPYFENLFYGQMAMHDQAWHVHDNEVEPEVFKVVLAHCYEKDLLDENLEMTLQVYKLADCYLIDSLKSQCLEHIRDTLSKDNYTDIKQILEWSINYGFIDIEDNVFEILSTKLNLDKGWEVLPDVEMHEEISNMLLNLPLEKHEKFLSRCEHLDALIFEESWRHPKEILSCEVLMSILESASCKTVCDREDYVLRGCISQKVLNHFINMEKMSITPFKNKEFNYLNLQLSLIDEFHSQALYECIQKCVDVKLNCLNINLHIPCNKISPESLANWSSKKVSLYLSNVDDQSVPLAVATILSIKPYDLILPKSSLSFNGFKTLIVNLESEKMILDNIDICSCNMIVDHVEELNTLSKSDICIHKLDEKLFEW